MPVVQDVDGGHVNEQDDGDVFGLDGFAGPAQEPPTSAARANRWRIGAASAGAAVVLAGGIGAAVAEAGAQPSTEASAVVSLAASSPASAPSTPTTVPAPIVRTTSAPTSTTPAPTTQPTPTVPPDQLAAEKAELRQTAGLLTSPVRLSSPASWDRWLPAGKPYPGASTADDISTCPTLAARLTSALGVKISYWIGTLPNEGGCVWVPVPLEYDGPYTYAYTLTVSYLAGTSSEEWRHHFYEHQGAICPDVDVPAVGTGAILVRCVREGPGYVLVLPDQRRRDGVWLIDADTRPNAKHPASYALTALIAAVKGVYG